MVHLIKTLYTTVIIIFCIPSFISAKDLSIRVDASKDLGAAPKVLTSSIWIQNLGDAEGDSYMIDKFFRENRPAVVQLSMYFLASTKNFEDLKKNLNNYFKSPAAINFIEKANEYNTLVIVGYGACAMPARLSSRPGNFARSNGWSGAGSIEACSPPRDYDLWAKVVEFTLNYLKNELKIKNLGFFVGHEQGDRDWIGNEESFFKYYKYAAIAAKKVDENIKVGGIGVGSWDTKRERCDIYFPEAKRICLTEGGWADPRGTPMLKNFIDYVGKNNVPIDFINWHSFGVMPESFPNIAERIRKWMKDAGINDQKVKLYPADWTYWEGKYPADYLDTQEAGAYIVQSVYYMWKGGIEWQSHDFDAIDYDAKEEPTRKKTTFVGDWALFTRGGRQGGGITKPMYNAMKALSMATSENRSGYSRLIRTEFSEDTSIAALSSITDDKKKISVLVSNYIPEDNNKLKRYIIESVKAQTGFLDEERKWMKTCIEENKGDTEKKKEVFLQCKDKLISKLKDPKKIEAIDLISKVYVAQDIEKDMGRLLSVSKGFKYPDTQKIADKIKDILYARKKPKQIKVDFTSIPFDGKTKITTYTIDTTRSNACNLNKRTEHKRTSAPCGIGGAIDIAVLRAKDKAAKEALREADNYFLSQGYADKEIAFLKKGVESCRGRKNMRECMNKLINENSNLFTYSSEKVKKDFEEALGRYHKFHYISYYDFIDEINKWKEVSLEGSKKETIFELKDKKYSLNLKVEPNSIWLIVLNKES